MDEGGIAEPGMHETEIVYLDTIGIKHCHTDVNEMTSLQGRSPNDGKAINLIHPIDENLTLYIL